MPDYGVVYMTLGCAGLVPIDNQAPVITSVGPSGTINTGTATLTADFHDPPYSSGIGGVSVTLDGNDVSGCSATATHVSCDVSGLTNGPHTVGVTVSDNNEPPLTAAASSTFNVNLCTGRPGLKVRTGRPFWAGYWNYQMGILSVHYTINNSGPNARQVTIDGIVTTNGVMLQSMTSSVGDIAAGGSGGFLINYSVPVMVQRFMTTIHASAKDECGNRFTYP